MSISKKIYDDDREVYGRTSDIPARTSKNDIDGILARFGVKDVWWRFDIPNNDVFVSFKLTEKFGTKMLNLPVLLSPPRIYHKVKNSRGRIIREELNWNASMRNLYWYILTHLSQAYVHQSGLFTEFLGNILSENGRKITELMHEQYQALPETIPPQQTKEVV